MEAERAALNFGIAAYTNFVTGRGKVVPYNIDTVLDFEELPNELRQCSRIRKAGVENQCKACELRYLSCVKSNNKNQKTMMLRATFAGFLRTGRTVSPAQA